MYKSLRILLIVALTASVHGAPEESPFNVDFFPGWEGHYRPMEWMPVEVGITSDLTQPFSGILTISTTQDGLNTLNVSHQFVLTPDLPIHAPLVTKLAFATDKCTVRLLDEKGRVQWRHAYDVLDFNPQANAMTAVNETDLLIGLTGSGGFGLLQINKETVCKTDLHSNQDREEGLVYVANKVPRMMPWDWTGYVCLDLLILYNPDWSLLNTQQLTGICEWVSNGGRLLVVVGGHVMAPSNPLSEMLPFELGELQEMTPPASLMRQWKFDSGSVEPVTARRIRPADGTRLYRLFGEEEGSGLYATANVGFGAVGVLGVDPQQFNASQRAHAAEFWVEIMKPLLEGKAGGTSSSGNSGAFISLQQEYPGEQVSRRTIAIKPDEMDSEEPPEFSNSYYRHAFQIGTGWQATNMVMEHLYNIPQMRPLSIWWVILLLGLLAVLLGPFDYILLKRFDRLPMTWLTSAGWIILFTAGAYYGVQALRGGKMQLRTVSVCDGVQGSACAWNTTYVGLFAPYSGDFQMEGLGLGHWWSGVAPSQESIWVYNQEASAREISCMQHDGSNLPYSLPISIWTIQCLMGEWADDKMPFEATLHRNGTDIELTIDNHSNRPIRRGFIVLANKQGYVFEEIEAGTTERFEVKLTHLNAGQQLRGYAPEQTYQNRYQGYSTVSNACNSVLLSHACLHRTQAIDMYLQQGAGVVCVEYDGAPVPFAVKGKAHQSNHISLARQVVFFEEDN